MEFDGDCFIQSKSLVNSSSQFKNEDYIGYCWLSESRQIES